MFMQPQGEWQWKASNMDLKESSDVLILMLEAPMYPCRLRVQNHTFTIQASRNMCERGELSLDCIWFSSCLERLHILSKPHTKACCHPPAFVSLMGPLISGCRAHQSHHLFTVDQYLKMIILGTQLYMHMHMLLVLCYSRNSLQWGVLNQHFAALKSSSGFSISQQTERVWCMHGSLRGMCPSLYVSLQVN